MTVDVGMAAPDFTLMNQDRQPVTLSAYRGRPVLLAFFPAAFSDTCAQELCTIRDRMTALNQVARGGRPGGVDVLGISVDSFFALKAFHDLQSFTFPLLSDFNKEIIHLYGVFNEDMIGLKGLAKRSVFLLDSNGIVRHLQILEDARDEPDYTKLFEAVSAL